MTQVFSQGPTEQTLETIEWCKENKISGLVVGAWVWVEFEEKPDADTRAALKEAGFRWIKKRGKWAHNGGVKSRAGKGAPWHKYETQTIDA